MPARPNRRTAFWLTLMLAAAAVATAAALLQWVGLHRASKPLVMLFAIIFVAGRADLAGADGRFRWLLMAALACSMAGDALLMFDGLFLPGLVAFLLAHLAYLALFARGLPWLPSRAATLLVALLGVGMYAFLWQGGLPAGLRVPVALYVLAIGLMVAQAVGRATRLRDGPAWRVALGAGLFMLSDSLLATNRFVQPLPLAPLWVLGSYFIAQILIAACARPASARGRFDS